MRGYWLVLLLMAIRYGLLALVNSSALPRAAHFAPMAEGEQVLNWVYQASSVLILAILCFSSISADSLIGLVGLIILVAGIVLFAWSVIDFALTPAGSISQRGVYRFCRHPIYIAYFLFFLGSALTASSWILLILVTIFQICAHRLILAEERWCLLTYGQAYNDYMQRTGRYFPRLHKKNRPTSN